MKLPLLFFVTAVLVVCSFGMVAYAGAVPTTDAVSDISTTQATFNANGGDSDGWFEWGGYSGGYHWTTPNQTIPGTGIYYEVQIGAPMLTGETYYVRACDNTGCGAEVSWSVPESELPAKTNYGRGFISMARSGFNTTTILGVIVAPYTMTMPGGAPAVWMVLFLFIFAGYWLRPRDIFIPCMLAMIAGGFIWISGSGLGVPPDVMPIGQGLFYAAITGIVVSWFSK